MHSDTPVKAERAEVITIHLLTIRPADPDASQCMASSVLVLTVHSNFFMI